MPNNRYAHLILAAACGNSGRKEQARAEAAEVLRIDPNFSLEHYSKKLPYKNNADRERFVNGLRQAGLK